ncbi:hypothetical protein ElyMa_002988700 [Elysia marginata]|uniref:Uncharacterized protein n=1 Tax=Elysia marginata TaxID=1093978 RepID=A0AAV4IAF0_9GAST|nr:hypothetical protein ElyMa_002988700 [Elysia marginata]
MSIHTDMRSRQEIRSFAWGLSIKILMIVCERWRGNCQALRGDVVVGQFTSYGSPALGCMPLRISDRAGWLEESVIEGWSQSLANGR